MTYVKIEWCGLEWFAPKEVITSELTSVFEKMKGKQHLDEVVISDNEYKAFQTFLFCPDLIQLNE